MLPVALESHGDNQWYLDLETGDVIAVFDDPEEEEEIENAPERFLLIAAPVAPHDDFRVMEDNDKELFVYTRPVCSRPQ